MLTTFFPWSLAFCIYIVWCACSRLCPSKYVGLLVFLLLSCRSSWCIWDTNSFVRCRCCKYFLPLYGLLIPLLKNFLPCSNVCGNFFCHSPTSLAPIKLVSSSAFQSAMLVPWLHFFGRLATPTPEGLSLPWMAAVLVAYSTCLCLPSDTSFIFML